MRTSTFALIACSLLLGCTEREPAVKSVDDYKADAMAAVAAWDAATAKEAIGDDSVVFVDVREADEIAKLGMIEGAVPIPRGVLEFSIDPKSAYHKDIFSSGKKVVFYCATGGRSMLAAKLAKDMGVADPVYLEGGFKAWAEADGARTPPTVTE